MQCTRIAPAARIAGLVMVLGFLLMPATNAAAGSRGTRASERILIPSASWHGRPIQAPQRDKALPVSTAASRLDGWSAGPVSMGTGTHRPAGSQRVREIQWRLRVLGYRPGPIDGIFGPRTRAAVGWFQVKHRLRVDGRASRDFVRHLRARTTPGGAARTGGTTTNTEAGIRAGTAPQPASNSTRTAVVSGRDGMPLWLGALFVLLSFALGFAFVALLQRRRGTPAAVPAAASPALPRALGYVRVGSQQREERALQAQAEEIEARCADHGMALAGLVSDDAADQRAGGQRPGLAFALEQMRSGQADCLVVGRLAHLARSGRELNTLLDALSQRETALVVLNADTEAPRDTRRWATARDPAASGGPGIGRPDG